MKFDKTFKLYLIKGQRVDLSIKISESMVVGYRFRIKEFENIIKGWENGFEGDTSGGYVFIEYKKYGPRPERRYDPYVRFSISNNGLTNHHRVTYDDMYDLTKEWNHQKTNKMYWDV